MRVAVFMGSSPGTSLHQAAAVALAEGLVAHDIGIVYGGAHVGLMGLVADTALAAGGEVVGVIPRHLVDREIAHRGLTRLLEVDSMHERKATMTELADAFVALPGGAGTLEELFEVFTWGMLGLRRSRPRCSTLTATTTPCPTSSTGWWAAATWAPTSATPSAGSVTSTSCWPGSPTRPRVARRWDDPPV